MAVIFRKARNKYAGLKGFAENFVTGLIQQQKAKQQQEELTKIKAHMAKDT